MPRTERKSTIVMPEKTFLLNADKVKNLAVIAFAACLILFTFNIISLKNQGLRLKTNIVEGASQGFKSIIAGAMAVKNNNFDDAKNLFAAAEETFKNIQNDVWFLTPNMPAFTMSDPVFDAGSSLIKAGGYLSQAGGIFTDVANNLQILPQSFFEKNENAQPGSKPSLTEKLKKQLPNIESASKALIAGSLEIQKIPDSFVPRDLKERFKFAKEALALLADFIDSLNEDMPAILTMLGDKEPHTYLVLLQNNAELRPSGGFIGNFAIIETNDGYITKNEVSDVYAADHKLKETIEPPDEIFPVNQRWFMRDSNYSGHFPLSAAKATWFLEKENGPGVDSVIAVDQTFIKEIMRLTGPITVPGLSSPITADNFSVILSYIVESKQSGKEDPKAIFKSFMPAFQHALFKRVDPVSLAPLLKASIESKHVLAYSKDPVLQNFFLRHDIAGAMPELKPREDYLNIVHTSIGGNKSDDYIFEMVEHDTYLNSDGTVKDELTITRTHQWDDETERYVKSLVRSFGFGEAPQKILGILGDSRNLQMLRIYVPKGSVLETSSDPSITTHFDTATGKTYFLARMETGVKDSRNIKIRYKLPFTLNLDPVDKYLLTVQKQPGQENVFIGKRIFPDSRVLNYKYFPENGSFDIDGVWNFEAAFNKDMVFSSIWGK